MKSAFLKKNGPKIIKLSLWSWWPLPKGPKLPIYLFFSCFINFSNLVKVSAPWLRHFRRNDNFFSLYSHLFWMCRHSRETRKNRYVFDFFKIFAIFRDFCLVMTFDVTLINFGPFWIRKSRFSLKKKRYFCLFMTF